MNNLLSLAQEKSRNSEWRECAALYQRALDQQETNGRRPENIHVMELLARSHYRAAFQSTGREEFRNGMQSAKELYDAARELYKNVGAEEFSKRSQSRGLFAAFWLEESSEDRRKLVEACIALSGEAAQMLEAKGNLKATAETHGDLLTYLREALHLAVEWKQLIENFQDAVELGRKTVAECEALNDDETLVGALHVILWLLAVEAEIVLEPTKFKELAEETTQYGKRITEVAQRIGTTYALSLANEAAGDIAWDIEGDFQKALSLYRAAASQALATRDVFIIGRLSTIVTALEHWRAMKAESSDERKKIIESGLRFGADATQKLAIPMHTSYLAKAYAFCATCYTDLADLVETQLDEKRERLTAAVEMARRGMVCENGTKEWQASAHELSKAMYLLSKIEPNLSRKETLLKEALPVREQTVRVTDALQPHSWNSGVMRNYLALAKAELASLERDPHLRMKLLQEAVSDMEKCRESCEKWLTIPGSQQLLGRYCEWHGDILFQLYGLTGDHEVAARAIKTYDDAVSLVAKSGQIGSLGPLNWKIAKAYDSFGDFERASDIFRGASEAYVLGAQKIPGLTSAYADYARYMDAWAHIENARIHHREEQYQLAAKSYNEAANALLATRAWRYLSRLCTARSLLEKGEALSRNEKHSTATGSFAKAMETFRETRQELETMMKAALGMPETQDLTDWLTIAVQRENFALGRMELEEARTLDRKGEKTASSKKYRTASQAFEALQTGFKDAQDTGELETLARFCDAWSIMKDAESKDSPEIFAQAAESFGRAGESTTKETFRLLALADASMCRALEFGTRFRRTRNADFYSETKKQLESAADLYQRAGFSRIASWTRATQRLFDALVYMLDAETERGPERKTELYHLAEKQLESAVKLYGEAGFPTDRQQALQQLGRAREAKELLLTSIRALAEIPTASGTTLSSISPGRGQALGLNRLEDANVVGEMKPSQGDLTLASDFNLDLEMTNVGKTAATLLRLEDAFPEGFDIGREENQLSLEGRSIDLKGKRLDYLKTCGIKVSLKPTRKGAFELRPRLTYVDDKGNHRSYQFRPELILVHEPGISGPRPAPSHIRVPEQFRFEDARGREIFQYLTETFLNDHMSKRLRVESAGWRSLMDIIRELRLPRSTLYGPGGRKGSVLAELERRGLVETRIFPKERGRGGEIIRIRVAYENTIVRRILEQIVMENP